MAGFTAAAQSGSKGNKGDSGSATQMGGYGAAPRLGVSQADTDRYNTDLAAFDRQQEAMNAVGEGWGGKEKQALANQPLLERPDQPQGLSSADLIRQTTQGVTNAYGSSTPVQNADGTWTTTNQMNAGSQGFYDKAFSPLEERSFQGDSNQYSNALLSQAMAKINPAMSQRGLPAGSEINDTAMLSAGMQSILGGNQMLNQDRSMYNQETQLRNNQRNSERGMAMGMADRVGGGQIGDVMGSIGMEYGANQAPWMQNINRQNMQFQADNNMNMQNQNNAAANKQSKNQAVGNMGSSFLGKG